MNQLLILISLGSIPPQLTAGLFIHYSKEVMNMVEESSKLKLVFLPAYSPELNLIERVWHFFKKKVLYNKYYRDLNGFRKASIKFF